MEFRVSSLRQTLIVRVFKYLPPLYLRAHRGTQTTKQQMFCLFICHLEKEVSFVKRDASVVVLYLKSDFIWHFNLECRAMLKWIEGWCFENTSLLWILSAFRVQSQRPCSEAGSLQGVQVIGQGWKGGFVRAGRCTASDFISIIDQELGHI